MPQFDQPPDAGRSITVIKRDAQGRPLLSYTGRVLQRTPTSVTLEAIFRRGSFSTAGVTLEPGDRLVEHHFADRWHNILEIYDRADDRLKGWYCNITRPAQLTECSVAADDLALDLVITPAGRTATLDWDEFEALNLADDERAAALAALHELQTLARTGMPELASLLAPTNPSSKDMRKETT